MQYVTGITTSFVITQILGHIAMLVIALTIVRRRRLDAALLLAGAAILPLASFLIQLGVSVVMRQGLLYDPHQHELRYLDVVRDINMAVSLSRPVAAVLLLAGIIRTAAQPSQRRSSNGKAPA